MKLLKTSNPYLEKHQWRKIFLAMSIMTIVLYAVAMVFSLCGSKYFILNYQNEQMDKIESWFRDKNIFAFITWSFSTIEFTIIISFILKKLPKWYYIIMFYIPMAILATFLYIPSIIFTLYPFIFYIAIPVIEQIKDNKKILAKFSWKKYLFCLLKLAIAIMVTLILQAMILVIKAGYFDGVNHIMNLSATFIYAIEYDIALSVILFTVLLYAYREKGDSKSWAIHQHHGGSSQTSMTQSQKSLQKKNLTKTQRNKIRLLYLKLYLIQLGTFMIVMILPFLLGKVFEFLVMYLAFCIARFMLGFKYSLHYKKESICALVGAIIFGVLTLAVPFFYITLIIAILLGISLAILLHLSYKYKGFYLFNMIAKPDKFAELYVIMDGDLSHHHVKVICIYKGLNKEDTNIICDFAEGNKKSYLAKKYNYSEKTIERKINESIDKLSK